MALTDADAGWMRVALGLAGRALGRTWPNPAVGCVLVSPDGRVVGRGFTQLGGRPHAETVALDHAGPLARGATAYVTLEPCAHTGRTPPCANALIAAGVARVVVSIEDPDPRVNGLGIATLRAAGVPTVTGCLAVEGAVLNRGFLNRIMAGRPMVTLKLATSLDGRIATESGESRWITGPRARAEGHLLRARSDAVMVGAGTALADDPRLDVRGLGLDHVRPVRVVVSGRLRLPLTGYLGRTARETPLWLCHHSGADPAPRAAWSDAGAELIEIPRAPDGLLDPAALTRALGERGLTRVLCEGGGRLAGALLAADQVDEVVCFGAGLALGAEGVPAVGPMHVPALDLAPRFRLVASGSVGPDARTHWRRAWSGRSGRAGSSTPES